MDLKEQLLAEMSRRNVDYIAHYIGSDPTLFEELMQLVFNGKPPLSLRAAWAVSVVTDKYPELLKPYLKKIVDRFETLEHSGVRRLLLRYFASITIPETLQGKLYDFCYQCLVSRSEPPAVKVHAMQILFNIAQAEPDLKKELKLVIEELSNHESAAIKSRSRQILQRLS
jgi:hypothetical protein